MKILCLSDLHIDESDSIELQKCKKICKIIDPEVIVIAGDIFDNKYINPYKELSKLYMSTVPIIFCLGNHEFAYLSVTKVLDFYNKSYNPEKYNVHCLDVLGHKCVKYINFFGNVLWYDGSLKNLPNQKDIISDNWLDSTIYDFDFKKENMNCIKQIIDEKNHPEFNDDFKTKITINFLLTHCVPHIDLNLFSYDTVSEYNMYSGVKNLFEKLPFKIDFAVCGHTHRRITKEIMGCNCINIGNDYLIHGGDIKFYVAEL